MKLARLVDQDVDHRPLRWGQDHALDELLPLIAAAVAADQLHPGPGTVTLNPVLAVLVSHNRTTSPTPGRKPQVRVAAGQEDVAEATHRRITRLDRAERRHLAVLHQQVVQREEELAVDRRPIAGLGRDDQDVAVQAQLWV